MSRLKKSACKKILGQKGAIAKLVENYVERDVQMHMADAIHHTIKDGKILLCEAGTGTGKTFAYLAPALQSGKKVLISTGTKHLQDQLFNKDLPVIQKALKKQSQVALLKGRANYICLYRMNKFAVEGHFLQLSTVHELQKVREYAAQTETGEISSFNQFKEDSEVWSYVTSTADNCLGQECPFVANCFVIKARKKAMEADIVVVNHHLFFADLALKDESSAEILPGVDAVIFDEAHQLPEIAMHFFGTSLSSKKLMTLFHDIELEVKQDAPDMDTLLTQLTLLRKQLSDVLLFFPGQNKNGVWNELEKEKELIHAFDILKDEFNNLLEMLEIASTRGKGLQRCYDSACETYEKLIQLTSATPPDQIHWYERFTQSFALRFTPFSVADSFKNFIEQQKNAWIMTSATLSVEEDFKHYIDELGLKNCDTLKLNSPFNYLEQAALYVPRGIPDTHHHHYTIACMDAALPIINAIEGRTFILFTSHKALKEASSYLYDKLDFPLLVQGDQSRYTLLKRFKQLGNAVLLGTGSFWEGVDVKGSSLSCVIIDKLPFASPVDPIIKARIQALRKQGKDPFNLYQLPQAIITLKQGVGRLIRDADDTGLLMICDPRIVARSYAQVIIKSLPEMQRTRSPEYVHTFIAEKIS